jgi:hypothetical protein
VAQRRSPLYNWKAKEQHVDSARSAVQKHCSVGMRDNGTCVDPTYAGSSAEVTLTVPEQEPKTAPYFSSAQYHRR